MKPWIEGKVNELLGFEDEVVAEYVFGILESDEMRPVSRIVIDMLKTQRADLEVTLDAVVVPKSPQAPALLDRFPGVLDTDFHI